MVNDSDRVSSLAFRQKNQRAGPRRRSTPALKMLILFGVISALAVLTLRLSTPPKPCPNPKRHEGGNMHQSLRQRVVLIGAGHAHLFVAKHADRLVRHGHQVTLVDPGRFWYSGVSLRKPVRGAG